MAKKRGKSQDEVIISTLQVPRKEAEENVRSQIKKGREILRLKIRSEEDLLEAGTKRREWSDYNDELLRRIANTDDLYMAYHRRPATTIVKTDPDPFVQRVLGFFSHLTTTIECLEPVLDLLEQIPEPTDLPEPEILPSSTASAPAPAPVLSNRVFIVHGHDQKAKQAITRFTRNLGLDAIDVYYLAAGGRTLGKIFKENSDVGFAVVLLTADDVGAAKGKEDVLRDRARQSVILELGFFIGKLGTERVRALKRGNLELPSDFLGVLWISMDASNAWHLELAREMKEAGLDINLSKLTKKRVGGTRHKSQK